MSGGTSKTYKTGTEALKNIVDYASDQAVNKTLSSSDQNNDNLVLHYLKTEGNNAVYLSKYVDNVIIRWDVGVD